MRRSRPPWRQSARLPVSVGVVPVWFAVAVLTRETLVAAATLVLAALGARRIDVTWSGKAGTFGLMVAFPLFLASESDISWADLARAGAWITGLVGLALAWWAAALYVPKARIAVREGRADRGAEAGPTGVRSDR